MRGAEGKRSGPRNLDSGLSEISIVSGRRAEAGCVDVHHIRRPPTK